MLRNLARMTSSLQKRKIKFLLALALLILVLTRIRLHFVIVYEKNARQQCPSPPRPIADLINKTRPNTTFREIERRLGHLKIEKGGIQHGSQSAPGDLNPFGINRGMRIAIIVPYRDRRFNLNLFLSYMHPFLGQQSATFGVYLVEPSPRLKFNRALLMNIGFAEASKNAAEDWNCFVFHDVDMLPENEDNVYSCYDKMPKQMAVSVSTYNYRTRGYFEEEYFGGVNAFTKKQILDMNGFSNRYFNWGGEDDDARIRVLQKHGGIFRLDPDEGRYYAKCHEFQEMNHKREELVREAAQRMQSDGLSSLAYEVKQTEVQPLFTRILVSYDDHE